MPAFRLFLKQRNLQQHYPWREPFQGILFECARKDSEIGGLNFGWVYLESEKTFLITKHLFLSQTIPREKVICDLKTFVMHMQCTRRLGYMLNQVVKKSKETVIEGIEKFGVIKRILFYISSLFYNDLYHWNIITSKYIIHCNNCNKINWINYVNYRKMSFYWNNKFNLWSFRTIMQKFQSLFKCNYSFL